MVYGGCVVVIKKKGEPLEVPSKEEVLKDVLGAFERVVKQEWIDQAKQKRDKGYVDESPSGYYDVCIVPFYLRGSVVTIIPTENFKVMFEVFKRSRMAEKMLKSTVLVQVDLTRPAPSREIPP